VLTVEDGCRYVFLMVVVHVVDTIVVCMHRGKP